MAAEFIGQGLKAEAVRAKLQEAQAAESAKRVIVTVDSSAPPPAGGDVMSQARKAAAARQLEMASPQPLGR
jgi:hypothetical protein